jgi:hypothetical protein
MSCENPSPPPPPAVGHPASHDRRPRQALLLLVAGSVLALSMGIFLAVSLESVLWLILGVTSIIANAGLTVVRRWRLGRSRPGSPTGRTLVPPPELELAPSAAMRWTGGANVPGSLGRINATSPLAVLELTGPSLHLYFRPRPIARLFGIGPVTATNSDNLEAFPVKGKLGASGVGVGRSGDAVVYFWTTQREEVLQALASAGFRVTWEERRYRY